MLKYNPKQIEKKWQAYWNKNETFKIDDNSDKKKFYVLDMFPYPSGAGLHVGHPKGYIATDIIARMKMMQGYNVLHPMGWDAFGLPAENYAIKNKVHPAKAVKDNIKTFKEQLCLLGFTYDWSREVNTTDPQYYKWTQWAFLQMFKKGLAYESNEPINWCPTCQTGLANEDLEAGKCERCGSEIERKPMRQWVLKITQYADRLLQDLEKLPNWPESIKTMQKDWIGRSEGVEVKFGVVCHPEFISGTLQSKKLLDGEILKQVQHDTLKIFTTRPDTLFGCTYMVVAPEHSLIMNYESRIKNYEEVNDYIKKAKLKSDLERTELQKEKTGVELKGIKAINPVNGEELPIFVADYILVNYGTGAIMAVPAHDERDWEFAKKYDLPIKQVVAPHFIDKNNLPRKDKKRVECVSVQGIVKHWKENKVIQIQWKKMPWKTFVIGETKQGENTEEAIKREIVKETGYKNFKSIKKLGSEMRSEWFAEHKDENRYAKMHVFVVELADGECDEMNEEEKAKHEVAWVPFEEIPHFVAVGELSYIWDKLNNESSAFCENGIAINSDFINELETNQAKEKMIEWLEQKNIGKREVNYKIRDWVFSRQRYWGEPIPLIKCEKCDWVPIPEDQLPLELPEVENYKPSGTGESPLVNIEQWVNTTCPKCGGPAKRETNTMPQWAGSCWYYLAYCMSRTKNEELRTKNYDWNQKLIGYWNPVDVYVGGAEHATRHLIYARFWHKFLYDIGAVANEEPFTRLQNVGLILAEDGRKMSKRWNNIINPDDVIAEFGADSMRLYEMFMGPFDQPCAWSTRGVVGMFRFLERVWSLQTKVVPVISTETKEFARLSEVEKSLRTKTSVNRKIPRLHPDANQDFARDDNNKLEILLNQTIKKVTEDIDKMHYNTAIAQMMTLVNEISKQSLILNTQYSILIKLLSPFAPHLCEELWSVLGNKESIVKADWPQYDESKIVEDKITLAIQVNGKLRDTIEVGADISEDDAKSTALLTEKIQKYLEGKEPKKVIYVKGKLVSIVI